MKAFIKLNNETINNLNARAVPFDTAKNHRNTFKYRKNVPAKKLSSGSTIFGSKHYSDVPSQCRRLAQAVSKMTITHNPIPEGNVMSSADLLAARLCKIISLVTRDRTTSIQQIIPAYSIMRMDEYAYRYGGQVASADHTDPQIEWYLEDGDLTATVYLNLFFFFGDHVSKFLDTDKYDVTVMYEVNDSLEHMGFNTASFPEFEITDLQIDTIFTFFDDAVASPMPTALVGSYNIFVEDIIALDEGATSARLLLRCPYAVFATHYVLTTQGGTRLSIKKIRYTIQGERMEDIETQSNYGSYTKNPYNSYWTFTDWKNITENRDETCGLVSYYDMSPTVVELFFDPVPYGGIIRTFSEYITEYNVKPSGEILLQNAKPVRFNTSFLPVNAGP